MMICGHLDNNEHPGQADCCEKGTDHSEGSTEEAEAKKSECFWKTLEMHPNQNLETLGTKTLKTTLKEQPNLNLVDALR